MVASSRKVVLVVRGPSQLRAQDFADACASADGRRWLHRCASREGPEDGTDAIAGSHIMLCCLLTGKYRVATIDNFHNSQPEACKRVSKLAREALPAGASEQDKADMEIDTFKGDINDPAALENVFSTYAKDGGVWGVIHVAALKAVGESAEIPLSYYQTNISATIMDQYKCYNLVYSSSATVYGAPKSTPIPETFPLQPESCYGRTKMMAELIIKDLCDSAPEKWRAIALRYFNPAGAHESGQIGESPVGRPGNLLPLLAAIAVGRYSQEPFVINGNDYPTPDGACVRDYIHVMDLAEGHISALEALGRDSTFAAPSGGSAFGTAGGKYKAYNLGKGKGMSIFEMIAAMHKASGFEYKYQIGPRRKGDVPDLTADPSLAEKELGFKATRDLDAMGRDLWNWQSKNPHGYDTPATNGKA